MIRVDIETIVMASGPVPSTIILRERSNAADGDAPKRTLSIQTGSFEAAAISRGLDSSQHGRPITHDLFVDTLAQLGVKLERVEVNRVDAPVFYARLALSVPAADGDDNTATREVTVDARPSDAIALAVRANAPIYVEDDVMNRAGTLSRHRNPTAAEDELAQFDQFVQTLSPDDF